MKTLHILTLVHLSKITYILLFAVVVQLLSRVKLFVTHGLQHARLPCLSPSPGACSNSCTLSQWCHPTISSFVIAFSSCPQSFSSTGSFLMSRLFASGDQNIGASALASVLPMNNSGLISFRIVWFDLLAVQRTLKSLLQYYNSKASILFFFLWIEVNFNWGVCLITCIP